MKFNQGNRFVLKKFDGINFLKAVYVFNCSGSVTLYNTRKEDFSLAEEHKLGYFQKGSSNFKQVVIFY